MTIPTYESVFGMIDDSHADEITSRIAFSEVQATSRGLFVMWSGLEQHATLTPSPIIDSLASRLRELAIICMRNYQNGSDPNVYGQPRELRYIEYVKLPLVMYVQTKLGIYHQKGKLLI